MPVQWFPGHMARAKRTIAADLALVDVVLEVVDARVPAASANADLEQLLQGKPRVVLLNKADRADPAATRAWVAALGRRAVPAVAFAALGGEGVKPTLAAVEAAYAPRRAAQVARGVRPRSARAMVVGIPNVGKSAVINRLAGGKHAITGDKPGVTRGRQWVRAGSIELLDTPGVLQPKFAEARAGYLLAASGAVSDAVFDPVEVAAAVLPELWQRAAAVLAQRFGLAELAEEPVLSIDQIARNRGLLRPGGLPDRERAALLLIKEFREGQLGRLTLEEPPKP